MKISMFARSCWTVFAASALALSSLTLFSQSITNPSFENNTFTLAPGTINSNTAITGWSVTDTNRAGLNPAGGLNPYANDGAVPNGTNVAVLLPTNVLSTTISGMTPGTVYNLKFRANSQVNNRPTMRVAIDNIALIDVGGVSNVAGLNIANPYQFVSLTFTAAATAQTLYITNDAAGGNGTNALLVDDFSIAASTSGWSIDTWSSDATSGVDSSKNYTHAYSFGTGAATTPFTINGVTFTRLAGTAPNVAGEFITQNLGSTTTDPGNVPKTSGGGSATLGNQFAFGGDPAIITINNLVPGKDYVLTFFSVGWDAVGRSYGRAHTWGRGDDKLSVNQDHFGNDQGIRIIHRYTAPASGSITVSNKPFSGTIIGSCHTYGFANYEVNPQSLPVIGVAPVSKSSVPGAMVGWATTAGGARPLAFRWLKDGVEIPGQTSRFLTLSNLTATDLAGYSIWVSNSFGMVTSSTAQLTFDVATIPNPSFEADLYTFWPGYASSGNVPISGWTMSTPGRSGINPIFDGQAPFANTGTIPDGSQAAFLQPTSSLRTTISGLTVGSNYTVQFRSNGRNNGTTPRAQLHISIDGVSVLDTVHNPVGGTNAYRYVSFPFTATSTNALLGLTNDTVADFSVNIDNFTIATSNSQWSFAIWTNDATSGADPTKLYTHAYHFGASVTDTNINGVTFRGLSGANPSVAGFYSMAGFGSSFAGDVNVLTTGGGNSAGIASTFIYGGPVQTITLTNLVPGNEYVASIYGVAFDVRSYGRSATFQVGNDRMTINLDHFGLDNGNIVSYRYLAPSNGSITFTYTPTDSGSTFHTYAFANRVATDSKPVIGGQPQSTFVPVGSTTTLSVGMSAGSLPLYFQWRLNGVDITDQTNTTLVITNGAYGLNGYTVVVTNFLGSVTSVVATIEVGAAFSELFNTGVDALGAVLPGGQIDPHYLLASSPDTNFPGPQAITMYDNVYPVIGGTYFTNGLNALSSWISSATNTVAGAAGLYVYRTTFVIDTVDPTHAQINGRWASDNDGVAVILNGAYTGVSNLSTRTFGDFATFVITNGFVTGSNTIDLVVTNLALGYTGLRAELQSAGRPLTNTRPSIVSQPASRTVAELTDVSFTVLASGSAALTYQWSFEGFELPNETNRTLRLTHVSQFDQQGRYSVTVSNTFGVTNSDVAQLVIIVPPGIDSIDPSSGNQTVECGGNAYMAVYAFGDEPLTYQWYFGAAALTGQTNFELTLNGISSAQAGSYRAVVSNPIASITTSVFTVSVVDTTPPDINIGQAFGLGEETLECGLGWGFTFPILTDNCTAQGSIVLSIVSTATNFACGNTFTATRVWMATDLSGNSSTATQIVHQVDNTPPQITNCPASLAVNCLNQVPPPDPTLVGAADYCDNGYGVYTPLAPPVITHFSDVTNGTSPVIVTRTYRATDACGNFANCVQFITVSAATNAMLTITAQGTNAFITWPTAIGTCWKLEQTADLTPPRTWTPVTNAVTTVGTNSTVTVDATADKRFFRLENQ